MLYTKSISESYINLGMSHRPLVRVFLQTSSTSSRITKTSRHFHTLSLIKMQYLDYSTSIVDDRRQISSSKADAATKLEQKSPPSLLRCTVSLNLTYLHIPKVPCRPLSNLIELTQIFRDTLLIVIRS